MSDVLEKLAGWGYTALKESVEAGQKAMKAGVWSLHIAAAKGDDANRIHSAYSALWANAPTLFAIVDELAEEVREWRAKPKEIDQQAEIFNLRATLKLAQDDVATWHHRAREYQLDANAHKANFNAELEGNKKLREKYGARENETWSQWLERMASEAATHKSVAAAWKRDCEAERAKVEQMGRRLDAIKKAVGDE